MKKLVIGILVFALCFVSFPLNTKAVTLGEYEKIVSDYKEEIADIQSRIAKAEQEIALAKSEIESIKNETQKLLTEVDQLNKEIIASNEEIKEKSLQIKQLFEYLQMSGGENAYLEYIFGAESVTDFIYRSSIIEQMTAYNDQVIDELEVLIEKNNGRKVEIQNRKTAIEKQKSLLESKIVALGEQKGSLSDTGVTSTQQLKTYQDLVDSYRAEGCESSDVIGVDCAVNGSAGPFRRPITYGYITSGFGNRGDDFHQGVDMSNGDPYHTKIYPVANGTIIAKYYDYYGALVVMISHYDAINRRYITSAYAHMSSFSPDIYVGKFVTSDEYIGIMGNTGYSFGAHLHLELAPCRYMVDRVCGDWYSYVNFVQNQARYYGFGGPSDYINFLGGTWYTR